MSKRTLIEPLFLLCVIGMFIWSFTTVESIPARLGLKLLPLIGAAETTETLPVSLVTPLTKVQTNAAVRPKKAVKQIRIKRVDYITAQEILAAHIAKNPILKGSTVEYGYTHGYQAIVYFGTGRIVISPNHTTSLEILIAHECRHIIDFRLYGKVTE